MSKRVNLLEGNILSALTRLALPIMATSLVNMAYNMTDMIWIGRVGPGAVAAVGAAGMYMWLSQGLAVLARMGGQVKVAQSLGAGDAPLAGRFAQNSLQLGLILSALYALVMLLFHQPLIGFFKLNDPAVVRDAETYLVIVSAGMVFSVLTLVFTGLITATGNSKTPFLATVLGLLLNIVLDPLLIFGIGPIPPMGVGGAALATVLAQALVVLLFVLYARKDSHLFCHVRMRRKPDRACMKEILRIGLPSAMQSMLFTAVSMVIARLIAAWGDAAVAVQKVGSQIESISWMTADGFAAAVNSFVGQNYGAKNYQRARKGYWMSVGTISVWGILSSLLLIFCAAPIFRIFIPDASVTPLGVDYLVILGVSQMPMCVDIITAGAFAGYGRTLSPSVATTLLVVSRIPLSMVLSATALGLNGIWWSISITSILRGIVLFLMMVLFFKRMDRSQAEKSAQRTAV